MLTRWQLSITKWTSTKLSLWSCFWEKNKAFKVSFFNSLTRLIKIQRQVKFSSPEESGCIVAHENMYFSYGNYKTRSSKLVDKNMKCWVVFERSYSSLWLSPTCSKIARTSVKVGKTRLLPLVQLRAQEQVFNWLPIRWKRYETKLLRFTSLRVAGNCY